MPKTKAKKAKTPAQRGLSRRVTRLQELLKLVSPVPDAWLIGTSGDSGNTTTDAGITCVPCNNYSELLSQWESAMRWTPGLEKALTVMLASVTSTMAVGDQLWIKIIGPASCGKSTLCEAVSVSQKYVLAKSTIRGFHSGFGDGEEDHSLLSKVSGKTLVTKDGDTLLQSPNLGQILSEARDVYDTVSRTSYRNKNSRDYSGIRMTWLLCGTSSLRSIDSSELGERFLDCVIMEGIDNEMEDEVLMRVAERAHKNMSIEANGSMESQQDPDMTKAMQLTGGYVDYLRSNATDLLSTITFSEKRKYQCTRLGKFVAFIRARPSKLQDETADREFGARLASQIIRVAQCIAVVKNKTTVDDEVMQLVKSVALDTARGQTFDICTAIYEAGEEGEESTSVSKLTSQKANDTRILLRFLKRIHALETFTWKRKAKGGGQTIRKTRWRMTAYMQKLFEEVVLNE